MTDPKPAPQEAAEAGSRESEGMQPLPETEPDAPLVPTRSTRIRPSALDLARESD